MKFIIDLFEKKYKVTQRDDGIYEVFERPWWARRYRLIGTANKLHDILDLLPKNKDGRPE